MFPLGIAVEKRLRGREASLRHKRSGSRQTWNGGVRFFCGRVSAKLGAGVQPLSAALRGELKQKLDSLLLNADIQSARGHSLGRCSACCWGRT
jgi:hypothetical protein